MFPGTLYSASGLQSSADRFMDISSQCKFVPGRFVVGCFFPLQVRRTASSYHEGFVPYIYLYSITLIAEYYAQGCLVGLPEVEESRDISWHSRDMPVKPPRPEGDSQAIYIPTDIFFHINIFSLAGLEPVRKRYVAQ